MAGKSFLQLGLGRTINSGRGTNIVGDDRIPGFDSISLLHAGLNIPQELKVADLINHDTAAWRTDLIATLFPEDIQLAILSIPIGNVQLSDKWKWKPSKTGKFTVKAAYSFIVEYLRNDEEHPVAVVPPQTWKIVWKLKIPPRIIHFIWRCVYGALPFADSLARRGVIIDDSCPFCEDGPSRAIHLFFECLFALDVWKRAGMVQDIAATHLATSQLRFITILSKNDFNNDLFSILCYMIWYYRNKAIFEGVRVDDVLIFRASMTFLTDYNNFNAWPERFSNTLSSKLWSKPPSRGIRVFFDGAISRGPTGGTGVFVSDETGTFIHGVSKYYGGINNPLIIELLALRDAIHVASKLHLHSFSLLGDSLEVVLATNGEIEVPNLCAGLLEDISSLLLHSHFLGIHWFRRSENLVAHELSFFAKTNVDCNKSWTFVPEDLLSISTG